MAVPIFEDDIRKRPSKTTFEVGAIDSFEPSQQWSSSAIEVVGYVGAVIGAFLFIGIVHFCWRWCHPAQPDQHANNTNSNPNLELGPPPELPLRPFHADAGAGFITTECIIYLGDFEEGDRVAEIPACSHAFHAECIQTWLS
ncbi:RING-H2 finger protein ATL52-like [Castanea sativa]|uniref:RING-H2 finger protein ATL52-like n=1 Tax=Castanea sativa TaxID=21020 RepID=UPI003F650B16